MRRREFVTFVGGTALAWPLVAAPQGNRMRRVGVLVGFDEKDEFYRDYLTTFKQSLEIAGWTDGRNIRIDYRYTGGNTERMRIGAEELVAIAPDLIFVTTNPGVSAVMQATHTIPIVFANVSDSVGSGFVASLARPGGNMTGFHNFEPAIGGKWVEVLKEIAPSVRRAALVHVPDIAAHIAFLHAAEAASAPLGMTVTAAGVRDSADIERVITAFAREPNGGLVMAPSPFTSSRRELIIALAARFALPAVYPFRFFCISGGLVSYGIDPLELARGIASYVDRILRGTKPGELPVQLPTKYQLIINLKTAKALGQTIPQSLVARADEVIQ